MYYTLLTVESVVLASAMNASQCDTVGLLNSTHYCIILKITLGFHGINNPVPEATLQEVLR